MTEQRITWKKGTDGKEKKYHAFNKKKEYLGTLQLRNIGRHRHWCWEDQPLDITISPSCLEEVRNKQKELHNNRGTTK